jgi:hypothetical protein
MSDWRKKVDDYERKKFEEEQRREKEREKKREAKENASYERRLFLHKLRFRCCVCGEASSYPHSYSNFDDFHGHSFAGWDWSRPGDLSQCRICGGWACNEHIYNGICQNDAKRL